ncbi:MAG TPA: dockerin type I domain-containing protein, partial [Phycisphaerae bacterium]|nr:dockerin type I domain-containing protein [Phycisphaerae bacterium]
ALLFALAMPASAQEPVPPTYPVEQRVSPSSPSEHLEPGCVAIDEDGRYVIAWSQGDMRPYPYSPYDDVLIMYYASDGTPALEEPLALSAAQSPNGHIAHGTPSISMSLNAHIRVAWLSENSDGRPAIGPILQQSDFTWGSMPTPIPHPIDDSLLGITHDAPSAGIADYGPGRNAWSDFSYWWTGLTPRGLVEGLDRDDFETLRPCEHSGEDPYPICRAEWMPNMAMRPTDGYFCVAYAADEEPTAEFSPFNIALRVCAPDGTAIAGREGPDPADPNQWVNDPSVELAYSSQGSPAVSFIGDDIVLAWYGPWLPGCDEKMHIWARRFKFDSATGTLRDPNATAGEGRRGMFRVDSDPNMVVWEMANPAVALSWNPNALGRSNCEGCFLVAWNVANPQAGRQEVHGQYFNVEGRPMGREFRVNQVVGEGSSAELGRSAAHTVAFGAQRQVGAAWMGSQPNDPNGVFFTLLPPDYWETTAPCGTCVGDVNGDCYFDGRDIQPFVNLLLMSPSQRRGQPVTVLAAADVNGDGDVTPDDVPGFVWTLLAGGGCDAFPGRILADCNGNGIPDLNDIANATSQDCNHNFVPDECDIGACDPNDPNQVWCRDVNSNGVPDGCEPDCNKNGIPDAWDIANCDPNDPNQVWCHDINSNGIPDGCEPDCNKNDIPDSWEVAQNLVDDCNANGVPDECERDCNENGVPDACDIANQTSEDCNGNLVPDECDLLFAPPRGSLDCNDNGIPDECDIASCGDPNDPNQLWCQDCNANGVPDACDIAANVSPDENENGIPDECEGGQRGVTGGELEDPEELMEAWAEYFEWLAGQGWLAGSELSGGERFGLMAEKMRELGLPVRNWTMAVRGARVERRMGGFGHRLNRRPGGSVQDRGPNGPRYGCCR